MRARKKNQNNYLVFFIIYNQERTTLLNHATISIIKKNRLDC